jgi:hypothetical protein
VNQGTARIVIVVALVAVGAVVLSRGFDPETTTAATPSTSPTPTQTPTQQPTDTGSPEPTGEPTTEGPEPNTTGVLFMTLNGTSVAGLAGAAQEMLEADGYRHALEADNAPSSGVETTTVYYRGGDEIDQNRADAQYVAETYFEGAQTARLDAIYQDIVPDSAELVIVVGQDYADSLAA